MAALKAEGIILRKYLLRETSYILLVYTKEYGKIRGVIKGVRNPYPQFAGNFEIFTKCQLLFYRKKGRSLDLITQCETRDFFLSARKEIERLTYASYFIELVEAVSGESDKNKSLYQTLDESLKMLCLESAPEDVVRIFEIKTLEALGLSPRLDDCTVCGNEPGRNKGYFSIKNGGIVCLDCRHKDIASIQVSEGTLNFMRKVQKIDLAKTSRIKVSKEVGDEMTKILKYFVTYNVGKPLKSLKFLNQLKRESVF